MFICKCEKEYRDVDDEGVLYCTKCRRSLGLAAGTPWQPKPGPGSTLNTLRKVLEIIHDDDVKTRAKGPNPDSLFLGPHRVIWAVLTSLK